MILNFDVKSLEVVCAAYLSKDKVLYQELNDGVDIHTMNQEALKLPDRGVAKIFVFRLLYGGTIFHKDPTFTGVSTSKKFWNEVIERYYDKYKGIAAWHKKIVTEVGNIGILINPTGRTFLFPMVQDYKGEMVLPITQIKNYPVNLAA